jgi:hypothetical protein
MLGEPEPRRPSDVSTYYGGGMRLHRQGGGGRPRSSSSCRRSPQKRRDVLPVIRRSGLLRGAMSWCRASRNLPVGVDEQVALARLFARAGR